MGPALLFPLPAAPSDMVAPGSVTSRLGSVFPFLLVLVDLQYEGKSCPALARGAGSGVRYPRHFLAMARARGSGRRSRDGAARPGPEPAPGWGRVPGSGFVWGRGAGAGRRGAGTGGLEWSRAEGVGGGGGAGPGERPLERRGARRLEQPRGPASLGTLARRLATLLVRGPGRGR